jgi:hypothetical protein
LGPGEQQSAERAAQLAQMYFLNTTKEYAPSVLRTLFRVFKKHSATLRGYDRHLADEFHSFQDDKLSLKPLPNGRAEDDLASWASELNLNYDGRPAAWVMQHGRNALIWWAGARPTLAQALDGQLGSLPVEDESQLDWWFEECHYTGKAIVYHHLANEPDPFMIEVPPLRLHPKYHTQADAERFLQKVKKQVLSRKAEIEKHVALDQTPKYKIEHFEWSVRFQINKESRESIRRRQRVSAEAVHQALNKVSDLLGLTLIRNRAGRKRRLLNF